MIPQSLSEANLLLNNKLLQTYSYMFIISNN